MNTTWMARVAVTSPTDARSARREFAASGRSAMLVTDSRDRVVGHLFAAGFSSVLMQKRTITETVKQQACAMLVGEKYKALTRTERCEIVTNLRSWRRTGRAAQ